MWMKKRLLIWGTTYPEFTKSHFETVCTGAVDGETGKLVRIYPITLRYQREPFHHYNWIEADIQRNPKDPRPESHRIQQATIKIGERLGTKDGWVERSKWVLREGNVFPSVEALWASQAADRTSLGLIKPKAVKRVYASRVPDEEKEHWEQQRALALAQRDLFVDPDAETKDLVFMPIRYRVDFVCHGDRCRGHDMSVLDWGIYVLSRRQFALKGRQGAEQDVIAKIEECLDSTKKDAYVFLGNMQAHPSSFMIVGLYYPSSLKCPPGDPKDSAGTDKQATLPGMF